MGHSCGRKNGSAPIHELMQLTLEKNELAFTYLGYAGIILRLNDRALAFDVGRECIRDEEIDALAALDIQFYSHTHWDHWDRSVAMRISEKTGAKIVAEPKVVAEMKDQVTSDILTAAVPGLPLAINNVEISAIRGVHPRPITLFQVKWADLGIFHGADSGYVPLSEYPADVAFLPTGTPSPSCSPKNARLMASDLKPRVAVAMHGNQQQLRDFRALIQRGMPETRVIIPEPCELVRIHVLDT